MSHQHTPLFHKPWGWPEVLVIVVVLALVDFATPSRELLPIFGGYIDAIRDALMQLVGGTR